MSFDLGSFFGGLIAGIVTLVCVICTIKQSDKISKKESLDKEKIFQKESRDKKIGRLKYLKHIFENVREAEYKNVYICLKLSLYEYSMINEKGWRVEENDLYVTDLYVTGDWSTFDKDDFILLSEIGSFDKFRNLKKFICLKDQFIKNEFFLSQPLDKIYNSANFIYDNNIFSRPKRTDEFQALREEIKKDLNQEKLLSLKLESDKAKYMLINLHENIFKHGESDYFEVFENLATIKNTIISIINETKNKLAYNKTEGLTQNLYNYFGKGSDDDFCILKILDHIIEKISEKIKTL